MSFGHLGQGFGHLGFSAGAAYVAPVADVNKTASDTLAPKITEGAAARLPMISKTDTIAPKITEGTTVILSIVNVSDTIAPALDDVAVREINLNRSDTLAPKITESLTLDVGGTVSKTANDNLAPKITEAINATLIALTRTDTIAPKITDATTQKDMTVGDGLKPKITEGTPLVSVILSRADTIAPKITESPATVDDSAAVPGDINDLVVLPIDAATAELVYTDAVGADSHEYRYSPYGQASWTTEAATPVDNIIEDIAA